MWKKNSDTGKWVFTTDSITKDVYEFYKQELKSVKLYSKCLSGSTYLKINDFENLYPELQNERIGFYIGTQSIPVRGPQIRLNDLTRREFYDKYLKEDAFTLKNLFTPERLLSDQGTNFKYVDVATTETISFAQISNLTIDGIVLKSGDRVLVKDQISVVSISPTTDVDNYFRNVITVSNYYFQSEDTNKNYYYYNSENGVYKYDGSLLVRENDLYNYDSSYKYAAYVRRGSSNGGKEFHLQRQQFGYFPTDGYNVEFSEKKNWVLRHRVDYNNIYDVNIYDVIHHFTQSIFDVVSSKTYSIPQRTISVGEFGVIFANQERLSSNATYSITNVIPSKYKVNLFSIANCSKHYWICGDEGHILRVNKIDFSIEKIKIDEELPFMSIDFYTDQFGMAVGKFNNIYFTRDFGTQWFKLEFEEFEEYSYNRVVHLNENTTYVAGEAGVFIEFLYTEGNWVAYNRAVVKDLTDDDEYLLVDDITDLKKSKWTTFNPFTYSQNQSSTFQGRLVYENSLLDNYRVMEISISSDLLIPSSAFSTNNLAKLFIGVSVSNTEYMKSGGIRGFHRSNSNFGLTTLPTAKTQVDLWKNTSFSPTTDFSFTFSLPIDDYGNLVDSTYFVDIDVKHNWIISANIPGGAYDQSITKFKFDTANNDFLLMSGNSGVAVCYDINNSFRNTENNFIFLSFTQTTTDIKTIERHRSDIYVGADKVYKFPVLELGTYSKATVNEANITLRPLENNYVNRLVAATNSLFVVGNGGINNYINFLDIVNPTFSVPLDPSFNGRIKSKFLMLDYDVASKVNFFTDEGEYRLPKIGTFSSQAAFTSVVGTQLFIGSIPGQRSWINYSMDSSKIFRYYSIMNDTNAVRFNATFSFRNTLDPVSIPGNRVGRTQSFFGPSTAQSLAPSVYSTTQSKYFHPDAAQGNTWRPTTGVAYMSGFPGGLSAPETYIMFYDEIGIVVRKFTTLASCNTDNRTEVGDVIQISSNVIDTTFIVNRMEWFQGAATNAGVLAQFSGRPITLTSPNVIFEFQYFYNNLNSSITAELTNSTANLSYRNLNNYKTITELSSNISKHPIGEAYGLTFSPISTSEPFIFAKFNEKSAYYNLQAQVGFVNAGVNNVSKPMVYKETFLDFGFSPTYNLSDYLNKINPSVFTPTKRFGVLATFSVTGRGTTNWTKDKVYFSTAPLSTQTQSNLLWFGESLRNSWESLLEYTFLDIVAVGNTSTFNLTQYLITDKYEQRVSFSDGVGGFISGTAYILQFNKQLPITQGINLYHISTRNSLSNISTDLQLLNNIHRSEVDKFVQTGVSFKNLQSPRITKFPTESYMKALVSDYDIQENISAIMYTDKNFDLALNVVNVEKELVFNVNNIQSAVINGFSGGKMRLQPRTGSATQSFSRGDLIKVEFGETDKVARFSGYQTVIATDNQYIYTSRDYTSGDPAFSTATISVIKRDPFFNYEPIDLFKAGLDLKVSRSIEILPENTIQNLGTYSLVNVDLNKYKFEFLDGLSLESVFNNNHWLLEAEVRNAKVGQNIGTTDIIWYSGTWKCGRWFGTKWISGKWMSGDWYEGEWNSLPVRNNKIYDNSLTDEQNPKFSKWYGGRWFDGTWNGGSWYAGRRYAGDWNSGIWYNGIWNDGNWNNGKFLGGIWVQGKWKTGILNCDSKPSYWLNGEFQSGDFENGMWYNGLFGNDQGSLSRFGTRSSNTRPSIWHSGRWVNGEFHSGLNVDPATNITDVSRVHKYSIWRTGLWNKGDWYGGIAYNIDFRGGVWHGGILEEIQVVGVDQIDDLSNPLFISTNRIYLNGTFRFNPGDEIWIIDDDRGLTFSVLGSNAIPRNYRINKISEHSTTSGQYTGLYLNYDLSSLPFSVSPPERADEKAFTPEIGNLGEMGVRVVSRFKDSNWKTGIWTNGIMEGGSFETGIWYNGIMNGKWGQ
jgi:hypothetical protein